MPKREKRITFKKLFPAFLKSKARFVLKRLQLFKNQRQLFRKVDNANSLRDVVSILENFSKRPSGPLGFNFLIDLLDSENYPKLRILEFGSLGEGFLSTIFFDQYVQRFGSFVASVDIDIYPKKTFGPHLKSTRFVVEDDILFASKATGLIYDLVYFDSVSIDFENPLASMKHHSELFNLVLPLLSERAIVIFDDTPKSISNIISEVDAERAKSYLLKNKEMPGKGTLVIKDHPFQILFWEYACILRKRAD